MIWHDHHVKISLIVISNNNTYYSNMNYRMIVIRRTIYIYTDNRNDNSNENSNDNDNDDNDNTNEHA